MIICTFSPSHNECNPDCESYALYCSWRQIVPDAEPVPEKNYLFTCSCCREAFYGKEENNPKMYTVLDKDYGIAYLCASCFHKTFKIVRREEKCCEKQN